MHRIRTIRENKGWSRRQLASAAETSESQIVKLERGERRLTVEWLNRLAKALDVLPAEIIEDENIPRGNQPLINEDVGMKRVVLAGQAAPGLWQPIMTEDPVHYVTVPSFVGFPPVQADFVVQISGPATNLVYPDGSHVLCANADGPVGPVRSGDHVVAERIDGEKLERRVAEYRVDEMGNEWLWPLSDHRDHKAPLPVDSGETRISGIVVAMADIRAVPRGTARQTHKVHGDGNL